MFPRRQIGPRSRALGAAAAICALAWPLPSLADRMEPPPKELEGVGHEEKLGAAVPKDLSFTDEAGKPVLLGDLISGQGKPTILTLNYSNCPMLCNVQLSGFVTGLRELPFDAGDRFQIVTISLDPSETPEHAQKTRQRYLAQYGRAGTEQGWRFLVGSEANVKAVAAAVGLSYKWIEERKEFAHPPVLSFLSPSGTVSRYLYGLTYEPNDLRLGILEAAEGKQVSTVERLLLYCFHYDAEAGRYAPVARNIMRAGGAGFLAIVTLVVGGFWLNERKNKRAASKVNS